MFDNRIMTPLTPLVHFHFKTFLTAENADCMVCLEKMEKGVFHLARNTEKTKNRGKIRQKLSLMI